MQKAYMNKFLYVDLGTGDIKTIPLTDQMKADYIGGKGFGARILFDLVPFGVDPLSKDNILMFMTGPLTGTCAPSMRGCVVTKSPLTGTFLDSYFGGSFAPEIKYAGFDGIIIYGKAKKPVYLWINDDKVELRSAEKIWGMDALEANHAVKKDIGDDTVKAATIGQAGERSILFSLISTEYNRQAGRGGAGAVMGSKNLKAVAVRGTKLVEVFDKDKFKKSCIKANKDLDNSEDVQALKATGTAFAVDFANETGMLPHKNYKYGTYDKASDLADKGQSKHLWLGSASCMGCPIHCSQMGAVRTGKYKGIITDIVEYESAAIMGSNLDISDVRAVAHLVKLCDRYGLDSMSTGSVIGFAMEAAQKGIIDSPEGVELKFGSAKAAEYIIHAIIDQKDPLGLGKLLAKGVKRASKELGKEAKDIATHVKGLESPAWGPRGAAAMGLALMTADRGGCHQRAFPIAYEVGGVEWEGKAVDPLSTKGKAGMLYQLQNYQAGTDTLVKCDFGGFGISPETYAELLSAAIGKEIEPDLFEKTGERIWNITKLFNLRHGIDASMDKLSKRFTDEPVPDGPGKGHKISEQDQEYMRLDYYKKRGWNEKGKPSLETMKRLNIDERPLITL